MRMKRCLYLVVLLATCASWTQASEPWLLFDGHHWHLPLCKAWPQRCCCPDDYDRKAIPCVPGNRKGCGDDYCRKPLPGVPCNAKGCKDDYCPRNYPLTLQSPCEPWYRCGPVPCQPATAK
jgi:hypothetical protein